MPFGSIGNLGALTSLGTGGFVSSEISLASIFFANGEEGAMYDPSQMLDVYADTGATQLARYWDPVKLLKDLSPNANDATVSGNDTTIRYFKDASLTDTNKPFIRMEIGGTPLTVSFSGSLGSDCTIVFANRTSIEFREGQTVGTSYDIDKSFWAFLIIDRALTASEKVMLIEQWSTKIPAYVARDAHDFYLDLTNGNDANDGLTEATAKATQAAAKAQLEAGADGASLAIVGGGTLTSEWATGTGTITKSQSIHVLDPVTLDKSETPGAGTNGFSIGATGYTLRIYGEGNLLLTNIGNDAVAHGGAAILHTYDVEVDTATDGFSTHNTGSHFTYCCTGRLCAKSVWTHTQTGTGGDFGSVLYDDLSAGGSFYIGDGTGTVSFDRTTYLPPAAATTDWTQFKMSCGLNLSGTTTFNDCWIGAPHLAPGSLPATVLINTVFNRCYFNGVCLDNLDGSNMAFTDCFGPGFRMRHYGNATRTKSVENCAWAMGSTLAVVALPNDVFLFAGFSASTGVGAVTIRNSILMGYATAISVNAGAVTTFNSNSTLENNLFFDNTTNYTSGVTADGVDVTGQDPLLVDVTSDHIEDWYVGSGSPAIGAGTSGSDIGVGVAS